MLTRDYEERSSTFKAGADALASIVGRAFPRWQKITIDSGPEELRTECVKVGAGNVGDAEGFCFLAEAELISSKWVSVRCAICITREQKGIGRAAATDRGGMS